MSGASLLLGSAAALALTGCTERIIQWNEGIDLSGGPHDSGTDDGADSTSIDGGSLGDADVGGDDIPLPVDGDFLYANTPDGLYAIDPESFELSRIGSFFFVDAPPELITDIAINRQGFLFAVGGSSLFLCDAVSVECRYQGEQPGANAAGFVPPAVPGGDDTLYLANDLGEWIRVDLGGPSASAEQVGFYEIGRSSGDIASSDPTTVASIDTEGTTQIYAIDVSTGIPVSVLDFPDAHNAWGLAYFKNLLYAFSPDGQITVSNGIVRQTGLEFWGAASHPTSAG